MGKFGIKKSFCAANYLKRGESAVKIKLRLKNELERTHLSPPLIPIQGLKFICDLFQSRKTRLSIGPVLTFSLLVA